MHSNVASTNPGSVALQSPRLYYLDWLRVIAILMVFLFHSVHPFDYTDWHVKNPEQSLAITIVLVILSIWGMPFFFLVAGAGSWFALQHRTSGQYTSERVKRLLIPFVVGSILFSPIIIYCEWANRTQFFGLTGSFQDYVASVYRWYLGLGFDPRWVGVGYHLWFLGFLFLFAVVTLPLFLWLKGEAGNRVVSRLAGWSERRGALFLFLVPLLVIQFAIRPFSPDEHGWGDFFFQMSFFIIGYLLYADPRLAESVRRDWKLVFGLGTLGLLTLIGLYAAGAPIMTWGENPTQPQFFLAYAIVTIIALGYCLAMLFVGMRFLDFTNDLLQYSQRAVLPFFVLHQPVILVIAFFVVQWDAGILVKLPIVVVSSFVVTVGLYELVIRRIPLLQVAFGVKPEGRAAPAEAAAPAFVARPG